MAEPSRARLFLDEVLAQGEKAFEFLEALVNGGESAAENGWRDYKEANFIGKTNNPESDKQKIKKIWSENLSAFANTSGGILVWGFRTKGKIPDQLSLAADCRELAELLRTLANDATDPYVAGVVIHTVESPQHPKAGIVLCYIPASTFASHQALWGERTYFIRAQDSNLPCPQALLRTMFYPRAQARLEPQVEMTVKIENGNITLYLVARILNLGPATADDLMLQIDIQNMGTKQYKHEHNWNVIADGLLKHPFPLHPQFLSPFKIFCTGVMISGGPTIVFKFASHNTQPHSAKVHFTSEEVLECLKTGKPLSHRGQPM